MPVILEDMPSPPIPKMKYVGINLTKYVQGLYEEDYKTLRKYIKDKMSKWRDIYSWLKTQYFQDVVSFQLEL